MGDQGNGLYGAACSLLQKTIGGFKQLIIGLGGATADMGDVGTYLTGLGDSLIVFFFVWELFEKMTDFRFDRVEDAIRLGLKFVFAKVLVENSSSLVEMIYAMFFQKYGISAIVVAMNNLEDTMFNPSTTKDIEEGFLGTNLLFQGIIMLIVWFVMCGMLVKMSVQIAGIIFEIAIHKAIAPIAISTLCNDTAKSCGISFIKSYSATCLQGAVISICFMVFPNIYSGLHNSTQAFLSEATEVVEGTFIVNMLSLFAPIIAMIILSTAIAKSGEITKRMLGA